MANKKQLLNEYHLKQIISVILFWLVIVIIPIKIFPLLTDNGSLVIDYLILAPIFLFIILFHFTKPVEKGGKIIYVLLGFVIPYICLLSYIYFGIIRGINLLIL